MLISALYTLSLEKAVAPHSSTLAWKIPRTEEPGRLQSTGSLRVGHGWATSLSLSLSCIGEGNGIPFQCSCLENPRDEGAWWAVVYWVAQSRTWLKWLSSSIPFHIPILQCNLNWPLTFLQKFFKTTSYLFQSTFNFAVLTILSSPFMIHSEIQGLFECVFFFSNFLL